jgi:hypothetical protein
MNERSLVQRLLSPAGFGLVLLCLALPFVTVSCTAPSLDTNNRVNGPDSVVTASYSGINLLVVGSPDVTMNQAVVPFNGDLQGMYQDPRAPHLTVNPLLIAAVVVLLVAMGIALIGSGRLRLELGSFLAALAGILLVGAEIRTIQGLNDYPGWAQIAGPGDTRVVRPAIGFYIAVALLVVLAAVHLVLRFRPGLFPALPGNRSAPVGSVADQGPGLDAHGTAPPDTRAEESVELVTGFLTDDEVWQAPSDPDPVDDPAAAS